MSEDRGVLTSEVKRCARCLKVKCVTEFYPRRKAGQTLYSYCKICAREVARTRSHVVRRNHIRKSRDIAQQLVSSGARITAFQSYPLAVRKHLIELLDVPGRTVAEVAKRAGCANNTVYRYRRERLTAKS